MSLVLIPPRTCEGGSFWDDDEHNDRTAAGLIAEALPDAALDTHIQYGVTQLGGDIPTLHTAEFPVQQPTVSDSFLTHLGAIITLPDPRGLN